MGVRAGAVSADDRYAQRVRRVWVALALAGLAFAGVCAALALGASTFLQELSAPQIATLEPSRGTQLSITRRHVVASELVTGKTEVREGDEVHTGPDTAAFVELFDGGTVQLYGDTNVRFEELRHTGFPASRKDITIFVGSGTVVLSTAGLSGYADAEYTLATSDASVDVKPSSKVRIRIDRTGADAVVRAFVDVGGATLTARGAQVELTPGTMGMSRVGDVAEGPLPAEEELIRNGSFTDEATSGAETPDSGGLGIAGWLPIVEQAETEAFGTRSISLTTETLVGLGTIRAVRLEKRAGEQGRYGVVGIRQEINRPADFFTSIDLSASVKVVSQAVESGGAAGNVFPLTIRVTYVDADGRDHEWHHSFYFLGAGLPTEVASAVPLGAWWVTGGLPVKSRTVGADIAVIRAIEIFGYGREFESWISQVSLIAR